MLELGTALQLEEANLKLNFTAFNLSAYFYAICFLHISVVLWQIKMLINIDTTRLVKLGLYIVIKGSLTSTKVYDDCEELSIPSRLERFELATVTDDPTNPTDNQRPASKPTIVVL